MNEQLKINVLKDLREFGKMCKDTILDLDLDINNPLKVQYIQCDTDICWRWDNADTTRKFIMYAYNTIKTLLCNKYNSDNLSISYHDKKLKLVYNVDGLNITTIV